MAECFGIPHAGASAIEVHLRGDKQFTIYSYICSAYVDIQ